jgi:molybdate-binding protein/DNA-binding XRE family transcriptional regulator
MAGIENNLGKLRQQRGFSAIQLAAQVDVSRQTIYAMEAGTYVPNTVLALKLAQALGATVEQLFRLSDTDEPAPLRSEPAHFLLGAEVPELGQPVQLCRIDDRLMANAPSPIPWYFPVADAVVSGYRSPQGRAQVQIFQSDGNFTNRILVAGCDPGISVLARHVQPAGIELVLAHRNSSQALELLKQGSIHMAGTHLKHNDFPKSSLAVISFAVWEEGIVTAAGNPKNIRAVEDLSRGDINIVNREIGSGCRALLDLQLDELGIQPAQVNGYQRTAAGHLAAAWEVRSGSADCCIATRAVARAFGLGFIPLVSERYDLIVRKKHLELPPMQNLLDTLSRSRFRRELEGLGGYDARTAGELKK